MKKNTSKIIGITILALLFAGLAGVTISSIVSKGKNTVIHVIKDDSIFRDEIKVKDGDVYNFGKAQVIISSDSTYIQNGTDKDYVLYSVDYFPGFHTVETPEEVWTVISPSSIVGVQKISGYIRSSHPGLVVEVPSGKEYERVFVIQSLEDAIEDISEAEKQQEEISRRTNSTFNNID